MKRILTFFFISILSGTVSAQVFWTEDFGSTCRFRGHADTTHTGNGAWTVTSIGAQGAYGNDWFVNDRATFNGVGNCASGNDLACAATPNNSLHVGGMTMPPIFGGLIYAGAPEDSSSYWTGFFDGLGLGSYDATTHKRVESPTINCSGKTNITITFNYFHGGDAVGGLNGDCSLWYYDGSVWSLIDSIPKTNSMGCNGTVLGNWAALSPFSLPASANNNPNVKIGFRWYNNDVSGGSDPSFAADNIQLSSASAGVPPVANFTTADTTSGCAPVCFNQFTDQSTGSPTSWLWTFTGGVPASSTVQNPTGICFPIPGTYSIKLKVSNSIGSDSITFTNYVHVIAAPPTPNITISNDTLFCSIDTSYTSYQWYDTTTLISGATHYYYKFTHSGNYNIRVTNRFNCEVAVGINVNGIQGYYSINRVSIYPSPALNELTITGNWQLSNAHLAVYNTLGTKVREETVKLDDRVILNVKDLSKGIYFLQIDDGKNRWKGQFVKD